MDLIDTHAHLDHLEDLDSALGRARQAGVRGIVAVSMNLDSSRKNLEIKNTVTDPAIYLGMGMHPSDTNLEELDACLSLIREHRNKISAVGEIGLDFWYKWVRKDKEKKDAQRAAYRAFLELAGELELPAVIHSRGVWRECFETARDIGVKKANFHWYSGPLDVLSDILDEGYFVSTTPSLAYSQQVQDVVSHAPISQTLIETDCPVRFRLPEEGEDAGFVAEPRDVARTLSAYAAVKKMDPQEALAVLNANAAQFFNF